MRKTLVLQGLTKKGSLIDKPDEVKGVAWLEPALMNFLKCFDIH